MAHYGVYRGQIVDASTLGANGKVKVVVPSIDSTALWAPVRLSLKRLPDGKLAARN